MAVGFVQEATFQASDGAVTFTAALSLTTGNLCVVFGRHRNGSAGGATLTDDTAGGNSHQLDGEHADADQGISIFSCLDVAFTGTQTYTFDSNVASTKMQMGMAEFNGITGGMTVADAADAATTPGTTSWTSPSVSLTKAGLVVVGSADEFEGMPLTSISSPLVFGQNSVTGRGGWLYAPESTSGAKAYTATNTNSVTFSTAAVAYEEVGASGVTVTPTTLALALAAFAPTVTATGNQLVTPTTAALSLATFAPTVTASNHQAVTPTTLALALSTFAPTVTASNNQAVTPTTAALTLAAFAPTVSVTANQLVTPGVATLTIATFSPTVTGGAGLTLTPGTVALALSTFAPTVSVTDHQLVTPTTAALTLSAFAPTVTVNGPQVVTPGTASLILATFAPTVTVTGEETRKLGGFYGLSFQRRKITEEYTPEPKDAVSQAIREAIGRIEGTSVSISVKDSLDVIGEEVVEVEVRGISSQNLNAILVAILASEL